MTTPIRLDLRRDLPKVRAAYDEMIKRLGACLYSAPCAIGAMMTPEQRAMLATPALDELKVRHLFSRSWLVVPTEQEADFVRLQGSFDNGSQEGFDEILAELEAKYASEQAAS